MQPLFFGFGIYLAVPIVPRFPQGVQRLFFGGMFALPRGEVRLGGFHAFAGIRYGF